MRDGRWTQAVELLSDENEQAEDPAIEARLVVARHRGFAAPAAAGPVGWPPQVPDAFPDARGIPEVSANELDARLLTAALQHHGALIVRGLLAPLTAQLLADDVRRAFDAAEASHAGAPIEVTTPWYVPFEAGEGYEFGVVERQFYRFGAVLAVESPRALFHVIRALRAVGLGEVVADYFGEWPALSAKKTSLRRARPDSQSEWHQDGAFLGDGTRTVNVWTALTPCGVDAPSVDLFARPFEDIVPTGTEDAAHTWSVSRSQADRLAADDVVRPEFAAGDAVMFNQLTLHRTGVSPAMTRERCALESWFFAPSTYPMEQVPIVF
jgi:hypothetical protein